VVARPDQRVQPADVVRVGHVERVEVDTGTPLDGDRAGSPLRAFDPTAQHDRAVRVASDVVVVLVAVPVGQQAQPGGRAHLQQGQRLGQVGEERVQGGGAGRLVGLGPSFFYYGDHLVPPVQDDAPELGEVGRRPG